MFGLERFPILTESGLDGFHCGTKTIHWDVWFGLK